MKQRNAQKNLGPDRTLIEILHGTGRGVKYEWTGVGGGATCLPADQPTQR